MREYKYDQTIYPDNSPKHFKMFCKYFEESFPTSEKLDVLIDVDGSSIQVYKDHDKDEETVVYDDYDVGAVYVKSDADISSVMKKMNEALEREALFKYIMNALEDFAKYGHTDVRCPKCGAELEEKRFGLYNNSWILKCKTPNCFEMKGLGL